MSRGYVVLCGVTGVCLLLAGMGLYAGFFGYHAPGGLGETPLPMGPNGYYFTGFAGTALIGWGGCLLASLRRPEPARAAGTATAVALVLAALQRMLAWLMGDYALLGNVMRVEAAVLLVLALTFLWLRPDPVPQRLGGA